ncbi:MAG: glycoside hydrolase family 73 protein, partial [Weissella cibaria]
MDKPLKIALTTGVMTLGIVITATPVDAATMTTQQQAFVNKMTPAILADTSKYGLYPSIQMAQATLESGWGQSTLSTKANNYFGVKGAFNGQSVTMWTTEYSGGKPYSVQAKFAKYPSAYESVDAQGKLLKNGVSWNKEYYAGAWRSRAKNYKEAAYGLQGRYATAPTYAQSLINLIEEYHFDQLDNDGYKNGIYYLKGKPASGYINDGNGWFWFENGRKFTGFRFYMGTYYWFENGSRIDNKWRSAW